MGHFHRFVGFGLVVDQLSIAVVAVHRHQEATFRVGDPVSARRPAESTKNLGMDDAKARTGKHGKRPEFYISRSDYEQLASPGGIQQARSL
jgi:hypothetical protein